MAKVIAKVLIALGVLTYAAFFLSWNMTPQEVVGFYWAGMRYSQMLPVGSLVFVGLIAGAMIMAAAAWSAWSAQKAVADKHAATVRRAKAMLQEQREEIEALQAKITELEGKIASLQAGNGTWGEVTGADLMEAQERLQEASCGSDAVSGAGREQALRESGEPKADGDKAQDTDIDDPDII